MTLKEIAEVAGVSQATVSLVLNNKKGVGDEKRASISKLLMENGYNINLPDMNSSILFVKYRSRGFVVEENAGFISSVMDSIEKQCRKQNYNLNIINSKGNLEATFSTVDFSKYEGIVILGTELDEAGYAALDQVNVPFVVIDNEIPNYHCNCVTIQNNDTVYNAVKYLKSLGLSEIGYFRSNYEIHNFKQRNEAFYKAVDALEMIFSGEFMLTPTLLGSYNDMKAYLEEGRKIPACVFAGNDTIAIGAVKALVEYGYKIPEDVSIIGFDDIPYSAVTSPALTTMNINRKLIGELVIDLLQKAIRSDYCKDIKVYVAGELIIRESTVKKEAFQ